MSTKEMSYPLNKWDERILLLDAIIIPFLDRLLGTRLPWPNILVFPLLFEHSYQTSHCTKCSGMMGRRDSFSYLYDALIDNLGLFVVLLIFQHLRESIPVDQRVWMLFSKDKCHG